MRSLEPQVARAGASVSLFGHLPTPALLAVHDFPPRHSHVTLEVTLARLLVLRFSPRISKQNETARSVMELVYEMRRERVLVFSDYRI